MHQYPLLANPVAVVVVYLEIVHRLLSIFDNLQHPRSSPHSLQLFAY
jgi:hypothetical protein